MNTIHDCKKELKQFDLKVTPARLGILEALENTSKPLDVATLIDYLNNHHVKANKVTVFRIMNILSEKGLVRPILLGEGKFRYEYAAMADHHHFICESCGNIEDISDCSVSELEKEIQKKKKFIVKNHSLEFFGICLNCQQ